MLALLNQYSFVIGALIVGGLLAAGLWRGRRGPRCCASACWSST